MKSATIDRLRCIAGWVETCRDDGLDADLIISVLVNDHGAVRRFSNGTNELRCAGIVGTATSGIAGQLVDSWLGGARRKIAREMAA